MEVQVEVMEELEEYQLVQKPIIINFACNYRANKFMITPLIQFYLAVVVEVLVMVNGLNRWKYKVKEEVSYI